MVNVVSFENVEVLTVGVSGPGGANTLFLVCGVAVINFHGPLNDYNIAPGWSTKSFEEKLVGEYPVTAGLVSWLHAGASYII